jgi:hypothetical protein
LSCIMTGGDMGPALRQPSEACASACRAHGVPPFHMGILTDIGQSV